MKIDVACYLAFILAMVHVSFSFLAGVAFSSIGEILAKTFAKGGVNHLGCLFLLISSNSYEN